MTSELKSRIQQIRLATEAIIQQNQSLSQQLQAQTQELLVKNQQIQSYSQQFHSQSQQLQTQNQQLQSLQSQIQQLQHEKSILLQNQQTYKENQATFQEKWNALLAQNKQQQEYLKQLILEKESLHKLNLQLTNQLNSQNQNNQESSLLRDRIATLENTINMQKNSLAELKEENKLIKLAKNLSANDSENHDLKIKINELVKDIDRCIDLLNE
jgi:chromosome segregation ATPase